MAAVTVLVLGFLVSYVLVRGVPNLRPEMFAPTYTSENQSMLPAIINTCTMTLFSLLVAVPFGVGRLHFIQIKLVKDSAADIVKAGAADAVLHDLRIEKDNGRQHGGKGGDAQENAAGRCFAAANLRPRCIFIGDRRGFCRLWRGLFLLLARLRRLAGNRRRGGCFRRWGV